jgi:hypothetical protein
VQAYRELGPAGFCMPFVCRSLMQDLTADRYHIGYRTIVSVHGNANSSNIHSTVQFVGIQAD